MPKPRIITETVSFLRELATQMQFDVPDDAQACREQADALDAYDAWESRKEVGMVAVGGAVTYVDPRGVARAAVVTAVWGAPENNPAINVVFVSDDETRGDVYGRQIERQTSVVHESMQSAHGNYWK